MNKSTRAAAAVGFALTLLLSINCDFAGAQDSFSASTSASTYQTPSAATASMAETPAAPMLQGASCGTIGPQSDIVTVPVNDEAADKTTISGNALMAGKFDSLLFLRSFSSDINQFKGKIAEKAFSFVESIQAAGRKEAAVVAPGGYTVIRQSTSVSPAVF